MVAATVQHASRERAAAFGASIMYSSGAHKRERGRPPGPATYNSSNVNYVVPRYARHALVAHEQDNPHTEPQAAERALTERLLLQVVARRPPFHSPPLSRVGNHLQHGYGLENTSYTCPAR